MKYKYVIYLSAAGALVSLYLLFLHFEPTASVCDINARWSCDSVNKSSYSKLFGIPVALLGMAYYFIIALLSINRIKGKKDLMGYDSLSVMFWMTSFGFVIHYYLLFAEIFLIKALCAFCLVSNLIITLIALIIGARYMASIQK